MEDILVTPCDYHIVGLGGLPFGWKDTSITRVCYWRCLISQALNWALRHEGQIYLGSSAVYSGSSAVGRGEWTHFSPQPPDTVADPEVMLEGLTRLRTEIFGVPLEKTRAMRRLKRFVKLPWLW